MNFEQDLKIYVVEIDYKTVNPKLKRLTRYRYNSRDKAETAAQRFQEELGSLINHITITKENLELL